MPVKNETSTRFMDEIRIISPWAYLFVPLGYLAAIAAVIFAARSSNPPMPLAGMIAMALAGGTFVACYFLLIGYVNSDAGRRGMSRLAWTLLAIFIPNALGIVLYFVLRKPRIAHCPQCSARLDPGFGFCPQCRYRISPVCPHCQRTAQPGNKFCPYCGSDLAPAANSTMAGANSTVK
jgi:hypothetical protein